MTKNMAEINRTMTRRTTLFALILLIMLFVSFSCPILHPQYNSYSHSPESSSRSCKRTMAAANSAAVSALRIERPKETVLNPAALASSASSRVNPPCPQSGTVYFPTVPRPDRHLFALFIGHQPNVIPFKRKYALERKRPDDFRQVKTL